MRKPILLLIFQLLLISDLFASAYAGQIGHTTEEVNLRQGPSLTASRIERLKAGAEVEVINRDHPGWDFVLYKRRPGFISERYIQIEERREAASPAHFDTSKLIMLAVVGVITIVVILMLARFKPWKLAFVCAGFFAVLNVGFKMDALYSLVSAWLIVVGIAHWLIRERKRQTSSNQRPTTMKKAA